MKRNTQYDANRPKYEWGNGWKAGDVTEKQSEFINTLATQVGVTVISFQGMTKGKASLLIEELKRFASGDRHSPRYLARDYSKFVQINN